MLARLLVLLSVSSAGSAHASVAGLFGGECLPVGGLSGIKDVLFEKDRFEMVQTIYADSECQVPAYDFSIKGTFRYEESLYAIDLVFDKIQMTVLDESVAEAFARESICGHSSWQAQEAMNVAGLDCGGQLIPRQGSIAHDIVAVTGDSLRFGKPEPDHDGTSPSRRPRVWDTTVFQAK
jgi:hypothetical protein